MKNYRILALDPGSNFTGWCLGDEGEYVSSGVFTLYDSREPRTIWQRLHLFGDLLQSLMIYKAPTVVGVEWPMGPGGNAAKIKLGMIMGIIAMEASQHCCTILEVHPSSVKATKCSKDNLVYASALAKKTVKKDEADAIGVFLALQGKLWGLSLKEAESQWKLDWPTR